MDISLNINWKDDKRNSEKDFPKWTLTIIDWIIGTELV